MLLPRYAAGTLPADKLGTVQAHLATCLECVQALYELPVGLPRPPREAPAPPRPFGSQK